MNNLWRVCTFRGCFTPVQYDSTLCDGALCDYHAQRAASPEQRLMNAITTSAAKREWFEPAIGSEDRKTQPIARFMAYFPDAMAAVAEHSYRSNEKHNPGEPVHWSREKSSDHADCIGRHLKDYLTNDQSDGPPELGLAWRAMALLQLSIEKLRAEKAKQ
jgi:hypothetical protein